MRGSWVETVVFAVVFAAAAGLALCMRPEVASLLVPVLGPWAGHLYGHHECTLAAVTDVEVVLLAALVPLAGLLAARLLAAAAVRRWLRPVLAAALAVWLVGWAGSGVLSVVNTLS